MTKIAARYAVVLVPTLAALWACGGSSSSNGSGDGGGGYGGGQGASSGGQGPCGAQSCATGCCDSNGVCQAGNTDSVCGTMNIACEDCTSVGKTCQAGQCGAGGAPSGGMMTLPGFPGFDAASFPTFEAGTLACTDGSGCPGQLCCFSLATFGSSCQAACANGSYRLCATGAECPNGQDCAPSPYGPGSPGYCAAMVTRPDGGGGRPVDSDASSASDGSGASSTDAAGD